LYETEIIRISVVKTTAKAITPGHGDGIPRKEIFLTTKLAV